MYGRSVGEHTYTWEPSGGLLHAGLVMRDRESDSWWSIITGDAIWGNAEGQPLRHLSGAEKATFGEWKARHPRTRVLSVEGKQHVAESPYDRYFDSDTGFRDLSATDSRLPDKALIFGVLADGTPSAIPQRRFLGGRVFELDGREVFLYRATDDSHYRSSTAAEAIEGARFHNRAGSWQVVHEDGRVATFEAESRQFVGDTELIRPVDGFDTFWYIWSLTHPETVVLPE